MTDSGERRARRTDPAPTSLDELAMWLVGRLGSVQGDASGFRTLAESAHVSADHARADGYRAELLDVRAEVYLEVLSKIAGDA